MLKKHQINNKGFSMIELVMAIAISVFVVGAAYSFIIAGTKSYEKTNKTVSVQQETTFISNMLGEAIRSGTRDTALIYKNCLGQAGDVLIYLGDAVSGVTTDKQKRVFFYDKSEKSLYVFEADTVHSPFVTGAGGVPSVDLTKLNYYINRTDKKKNNLVSKYVESFEVTCVGDDTGTVVPTLTQYEGGVKLIDDTNNFNFDMIRVNMQIKVRGKEDSTQVIYRIRS